MQGQCAEWARGIIFYDRHASRHSASVWRRIKRWRGMIFYVFDPARVVNNTAVVGIIRLRKLVNGNIRNQRATGSIPPIWTSGVARVAQDNLGGG